MLRLVRHGRPPDLRSRPSGLFDQLLLDFSNVYLDLLQYALGCHSLDLPPQTPLSVCGAGGLLLVLPRPPSMSSLVLLVFYLAFLQYAISFRALFYQPPFLLLSCGAAGVLLDRPRRSSFRPGDILIVCLDFLHYAISYFALDKPPLTLSFSSRSVMRGAAGVLLELPRRPSICPVVAVL